MSTAMQLAQNPTFTNDSNVITDKNVSDTCVPSAGNVPDV